MKKGVIVVFFSIFFIVSCNSFPGLTGTSSGRGSFSSTGVVMEFVQNLPPPTIYDNEIVAIQLKMSNLGGFGVGGSGDRVYLSGFDHNIITRVPPGGVAIPEMEGISEFNPQGSFEFVTFNEDPRNSVRIADIPTDRFPTTILATACYKYQTVAEAALCVDPDPFTPGLKSRVCDARQSPTFLLQQAPIAVSSVTVEPSKGKSTLRILLSNSGTGTVFKNGLTFLNQCSPYDAQGLGFDAVDYVQVIDVSVGGQPIMCRTTTNDGHVRMNSGTGQFTCIVDILGNDAYTTPLTITLEYGYREQVQTQMEIFQTPKIN